VPEGKSVLVSGSRRLAHRVKRAADASTTLTGPLAVLGERLAAPEQVRVQVLEHHEDPEPRNPAKVPAFAKERSAGV